MFRKTTLFAALALAAGLSVFVVDLAEAKRGFSFGSRGSRTYQAPPPTPTAPTAAPIQRSTTPQAQPSAAQPSAARPQAAQPSARPSMFGSGIGGALMRGVLIGGLVGLLLGQGLGGLAGILGLLLQVGLVVLVVMLVMRLMRRSQPVPANGPLARDQAPAGPRPGSLTGAGLGLGTATAPRPAPGAPSDTVGIDGSDLDAFEKLLATIQVAFSAEDQGTLMANTTPEVFSFLADELRENQERGVRNQVSDVKLLQGDLAEAWREGDRDFATVAMRYASRDAMVDRATGQILSGDRDGVGESTEVWTFTRERGGAWKLSAIQGA